MFTLLIVWGLFVVVSAPFARRLVKRNRRFLPWVWILYIIGSKIVAYHYFTLWLNAM
jgi:hypothetical protein